MRRAKNDVMTVPKRKLAAPYASRPVTGFQTSWTRKPSPNFEIERCAPSTTFQTMSPTRTVAPSAAVPASPCRRRSPRWTRRPSKGRRASAVASTEDS
jgi:hypothetical protein